MELSFGEQIKIILKRKNMTIQDLANLYEAQTGCKMTRQNLSQRLRRDNFPEQDMRILAGLLGFQVSVHLTPAAEESIFHRFGTISSCSAAAKANASCAS